MARTEENRILVFYGKHGDTFYKASTPEEVGNAALKELKWRIDYYIEHWDLPELKGPKNEEEISKLKTDEARVEARKKLKRHQARYKEYAQNNKVYELAKKALKEKDGNLAWKIIEYRGNNEYEGFEFEYLQ